VARIHEARIKDIVGANPGLDPRRLRVGQEIVIPPTPRIVLAGRRLDKMSTNMGINNPPFLRFAYHFGDRKDR
jgi:hypothetical protein